MRDFWAMVNIAWRGSHRQVIWWVVGLLGVFVGTAWSLHSLYPTPDKLATYAKGAESGAALYAINGRPYGLNSLGGVIVYEFGFIAALGFPVMGVHLVNRMTRREEQSGRLDLLRAGRIGRSAPVAAALGILALALTVVAIAMAGVLRWLGLGQPGVVLYPLSLAGLGLGFGALTALAAQLFANPRFVTGLGLGVLAISALARGVGDVRDNWVRWLSPVGWAEQTRPFGAPRWSPLLLSVAFVAVLSLASAVLGGRRDLGGGLFAARLGPARADRRLLGPLGFALRQHRGGVMAWSVVSALVGGAFGSLADAVRVMLADNQSLSNVFGGGGSADAAFGVYTMVLLVLLALGFGLQGLGRVAEAEDDSRLEAVLAGVVSRSRWLAIQAIVVGLGSVAVAGVGALAFGAGDAAAVGDGSAVGRYLLAGLAYMPAMLVILSGAVLLYGARVTLLPAAWLLFVVVAVIATLADTLRLPRWARDISPLSWVGRTPLEPVGPWAVTGSAVLAAVLAFAGVALFRRRDIGGGGSGLSVVHLIGGRLWARPGPAL